MIHDGRYISGLSQEAVLAHFTMSSEDNTKNTIKKDWDPGAGGQTAGVLFRPEELDIYVNKVTLEAYIFHGKKIDYESLERLVYDPATYSVDVVRKDGTIIDLGVKIQWLVRPYFSKASEISIVQTKDGETVDGTVIPLVHKEENPAE